MKNKSKSQSSKEAPAMKLPATVILIDPMVLDVGTFFIKNAFSEKLSKPLINLDLPTFICSLLQDTGYKVNKKREVLVVFVAEEARRLMHVTPCDIFASDEASKEGTTVLDGSGCATDMGELVFLGAVCPDHMNQKDHLADLTRAIMENEGVRHLMVMFDQKENQLLIKDCIDWAIKNHQFTWLSQDLGDWDASKAIVEPLDQTVVKTLIDFTSSALLNMGANPEELNK